MRKSLPTAHSGQAAPGKHVCLGLVALMALLVLAIASCAKSPPAATPESGPADTATAPAATPAATATPTAIPATGKIAWHSDRSGSLQIWVMDDNGQNPRQITAGDENNSNTEPAWSPDGRHIAFVTDRENPQAFQIYVMNADGSNQHPLMPFHQSHNWSPAWSQIGRAHV